MALSAANAASVENAARMFQNANISNTLMPLLAQEGTVNYDPQNSWVKLMRSETTRELLAKDIPALLLAILIAIRTKRTKGFSIHGLQLGEALIGDFKSAGLTERSYRTAKQHLEKYGLATFKPTNKGTVATLTDTRIFDVNLEQNDEQNVKQATDRRRASDEYQEYKKGKNEKNSVRGQTTALPDHRIDYQKAEIPEIQDYSEIHNGHDPILVAMSLTGERGKQGWGFWVKILNQARKKYGSNKADRLFRGCLDELYGEIKAGECNKPGALLNEKLKVVFSG